MNLRRVAVIGSNSFSGQDLVDLLLDETDAEVMGISRSPEKPAMFCRYRDNPAASERFRFHQLDLNEDAEAVAALLERERPEVIVNFAAQSEVGPSWEKPWHWYETNAVALSKLTHPLVSADWLQKYVHISSPEVYGTTEGTIVESSPINPSTPYAASKAAADLHLATLRKSYDFPLAWIRATNVYGAGQQLFKIIPRSFIRLKQGETIELHGGGVAVKSYIHIRDVSRGELAVAAAEDALGGFHISPDEGIAVRDVVRKICEVSGTDFDSATWTVGERLGQDAAYVIDSSRIRSELGWAPRVTLDEGLVGVHEWVEANWEEIRAQPLEYVHKP
ncbi:MAG: NAD-dependent epimerase/dehydratase family protein [Solirubrobacteraceae bacterium]